MKTIAAFAAICAILAIAAASPAAAAPAPGGTQLAHPAAGTLSMDPYWGASDIKTSIRFIVLCSTPSLDCNSYPDGTPCGDPELHVFCHCTTSIQGQHFCAKNP